jgi:glycosyltransferase involved in cell wall biosynthesis
LEKFTPASPEEREKLRDKYAIRRDSFVVLHVGHLNRRRNLGQLGHLQRECNIQVIVVVSSSSPRDATLEKELVDSGCIVMKEYLPRVEDMYRLSDCYVFPTRDPLGSIEFPLSILEALACDLPVISTPFGSLPDAFTAGNGVYFYDSPDDLTRRIQEIMHGNRNYHTRELALGYSWSEVARNLEGIYTRALE